MGYGHRMIGRLVGWPTMLGDKIPIPLAVAEHRAAVGVVEQAQHSSASILGDAEFVNSIFGPCTNGSPSESHHAA